MARQPISAMARAIIVVVLMVAVVASPAAAGDAVGVPFRKPPRRLSPHHWGRMLLDSELSDVQPSAGFADEYSPAASLDADDASASVEESASEDAGDGEEAKDLSMMSSGKDPSGEIAAGTGDNNNATAGASSAYAEDSDDENSKALVVVRADPVHRVTAKTKRSAAVAEEADDSSDATAPAPEANVAGDADVADAPGPAPEMSLDEETPAEAPEESYVNSTSEALAPAPAPWTDTEETPAAAAAPAELGLEPAAANERNATASVGDEESSSDAGDADLAVEEKHEKKQGMRGNETGNGGAVEEEVDAPAPAPEEGVEEDSDALAASQDPAPKPEEEDTLAPETPETSSPPPPVVGTISGRADDAESVSARAGRQDSREEVTSWSTSWSSADRDERAGRDGGAVQLEVAVGNNPESGESEFERAVPILLGGCALFVVGVVVYNRTKRARGKARGAASGAGKARAAAGNSDWNENWSDEEGGWDGKRRGSPVSAEKWAADEPAWSDDEAGTGERRLEVGENVRR